MAADKFTIKCVTEDVLKEDGSLCVRVTSFLLREQSKSYRVDFASPERVNLCKAKQWAALMDEVLGAPAFDQAPAPLSPRVVQALIAVAAFTALTAIALSLGWL